VSPLAPSTQQLPGSWIRSLVLFRLKAMLCFALSKDRIPSASLIYRADPWGEDCFTARPPLPLLAVLLGQLALSVAARH
jgi:hypothetical protein